MRPTQLGGEALQEHRRGDRTAGPRADVAHVGEVRLQRFVVLVVQRHAPGRVDGCFARGQQLGGQRVVAAEQARAMVAERDHTSPGQRGDVDHRCRLEALCIRQRIAQDQPAFGVGIEDLDRLPRHAGHHVARLDGFAVGHVLAGRDDADQVDLGLHLRHCAQRAQHAGRATHVELHLIHLGGRLDRDAAGVKGDAFADQHDRCVAFGTAIPARDDELQWLSRTLCNGEERAHAELLAIATVQHLDLQAMRLAELLRVVSQIARRAVVAGPISQLTRGMHAGCDRFAAFHAFGDCRLLRLADDEAHRVQLRSRCRTRLGVAVQIDGFVSRQHQRFAVRSTGFWAAAHHHHQLLRAAALERSDRAADRLLQHLRRRIARMHEHHTRRFHTRHAVGVQRLPALVLKVTGLHGRVKRSGQGLVQSSRRFVAAQHHQQRISSQIRQG